MTKKQQRMQKPEQQPKSNLHKNASPSKPKVHPYEALGMRRGIKRNWTSISVVSNTPVPRVAKRTVSKSKFDHELVYRVDMLAESVRATCRTQGIGGRWRNW
jgi:hypothetical protein